MNLLLEQVSTLALLLSADNVNDIDHFAENLKDRSHTPLSRRSVGALSVDINTPIMEIEVKVHTILLTRRLLSDLKHLLVIPFFTNACANYFS